MIQLSGREKDVAEFLLEGKSNKQIALSLEISTSTVEYHLTNIYKKLQVSSRTEAVLMLGKSLGEDVFGESPVEKHDTSMQNDEKSILTWRLTMNKKKYLIGIGLLALILLAVVFLVNTPVQEIDPEPYPSPTAQADIAPTVIRLTENSSSTPLPVEKPPTYPAPMKFRMEKVSNIEDKVITLKEAEIGPFVSIITICVFSPDEQQWFPNVSLLYKGNIHTPNRATLTDTKPAPGDELCYLLKYPLEFDFADDPKQVIAIWVTKLTKDQPERLPNEAISSAFQQLAAEGIEFAYVLEDNGSRINILKKPEGLTDEEVSIMIRDALTEEALTSGVLIFDLK